MCRPTPPSKGLERARTLKPDPFYTPEVFERIRTGGFDADLHLIGQADWAIEAIIEQAAAKQSLLERVDAVRRPGSIVSSNTSGLSITGLARGRSDDFRRHWVGTHFFNPPRYLTLVELIPTADTDPDVLAILREFVDRRLGKNVVVAKDTPGFIANHVAMHGLVRIFDALAAGTYTVEEIDAMTGAAIGRPKSATFRDRGHRRPRHPRARRERSRRTPASGPWCRVPVPAVRAGDARPRVDWRESGARLLPAKEE
jgi:3-hydroxyacyl-CoA dehydrogenase